MRKLIYILLLLPLFAAAQYPDLMLASLQQNSSSCLDLPLAGNGNAEEIFTSISMDNTYDGIDPTECGTGDNCINSTGDNTYSFDALPSNNNIYCVNEGIKLVSTSSASGNSMQFNTKLTSGLTYEYAVGIYEETGTGGRLQWAFGVTNPTAANLIPTVSGEWVWFTGTFDANAGNSQMNMYTTDGGGSIGDTVWYVIQIKAQ